MMKSLIIKKQTNILRAICFGSMLGLGSMGSSHAATIAGCDFSDAAIFNAAGGAYDTNMDDLDASDGISVGNWSFVNGGQFRPYDGNAQTGMPNDNVAKFDGGSQAQPTIGSSGGSLQMHSFSITIPSSQVVDLASISFDWRIASSNSSLVRWLAFDTSLDSGIIFSETGPVRNSFVLESIDLSGPTYQGLTNQTIDFRFYAGGDGTGDIDIDSIVLDGTVTSVPEPSVLFLSAFGGVVILLRRRR